MAIKLISFSEQGLVQFLQSHQQTQLSIKVNLQTHHNISYLKIMEDQFSQLNHLTEFSLTIPKYCALAQKGYTHVSNAIKILTQLTYLSIQIEGFIKNEELLLLQNSISSLDKLQTLVFKISSQNDINSLSGKQFVDSLSSLQNLRKLTLGFKTIKKNQMNEGNIHFWNGIQNLQNLEKLALEFQELDYGQQDLIELFAHIANLQKLKRFSFFGLECSSLAQFIVMIFSYLSQMNNLKSLEIYFDERKELCFNETERKEILKHLSNLKQLEKLKMETIQIELTKHHLKEFADLIGNLKYLKKLYIECNFQDIQETKSLNNLSQSFLNLGYITHFELNFQYIKVYNEFISDLSISLLNMKNNLSTLKLYLGDLNEYQCLQLGNALGQLNNLIYLLIEISAYMSSQNILFILYNSLNDGLINLKQLIIRATYYQENTRFIHFFHKLISLELLEIKNIYVDSNEDFLQLNETLKNFKQLKVLNIGISIENLNDQQSVEILESTFKELQSLESLIISFAIQNKSEDITKMNILEHLKNLKRLSIEFTSEVLNVFDLTPSLLTNQCILENVKVMSCSYLVNTETILEMIDSLSNNFPKIKKLTLKAYLHNQSIQPNQSNKFSVFCSRFTNLSSLTLENDSFDGSFSFYAKGIKKLKSLKQLELDCKYKEDDVRQLGKALLKLENLRKIKLTTSLYKDDLVNFEKELSKVIQQNKTIREIQILPKQLFNRFSQLFTNTVSLSEDFELKEDLILGDDQNEMISEEQKRVQNLKSQEYQKSKTLKLLPNDMKITLITNGEKGQEHLFFVNDLDNIGLQYLIKLEIKTDKSDSLFENVSDFTNKNFSLQFNQLNQLRQLTLNLFKLTFSAEQIAYFSQNVKHLINLRYLNIETDLIENQCFCDELKHLKELDTLELETNISEIAVVSLGKSLMELQNLQSCCLKFQNKSSFGIQGVLSIMNGLKGQLNLEKLILNLYSEGIINENSEEFEVFVQDFFKKMNRLYQFEFKMSLGKKNINILSLCSSLSQLPQLRILTIEVFHNHQMNQEMLDQLIVSINQLKHLREVSIVIIDLKDNNTNIQLSVPKSLSNYLNRYLDRPLKIKSKYSILDIQQDYCFSLRIYSTIIQNIQLNFLEDLDESKLVELDREDNNLQKLLPLIRSCPVKNLRLKSIQFLDENDAMDFCTFISRFPNVSKLNLDMQINMIDNQLCIIANSIVTLKNLHTLSLNLTILPQSQDFKEEESQKHLLQLITILQAHKKLSELNLVSSICLQSVERSIYKKMKKLVKYSNSVREHYQY